MHVLDRKNAAYKMRIVGHSYNEINAKLGIPKSTLNCWFNGLVLSDQARARLLGRVRQGVLNGFVKRNKMQTHQARQRTSLIRLVAKSKISKFTKRDLLLAGVLLYWAEGHKRPLIRGGREITSHTISFVNSDPDMIRAFIRFLREILEVQETALVLNMRLYAHINEEEAMRYWLKVSGLNKRNFRKTTYLVSIASQRKKPFNRLPYGTLQVAVYSTDKFYELMGFIDAVKSQIGCDIVA